MKIPAAEPGDARWRSGRSSGELIPAHFEENVIHETAVPGFAVPRVEIHYRLLAELISKLIPSPGFRVQTKH
jgi:hypothetical protein